MVNLLITAALAAALVLYIPFPFRLGVPGILLAACLAEWCFSHRTKKRFPAYIQRIFRACGLGIFVGLAAASGLGNFAPGLPMEKIRSLRVVLLEDPRSFLADKERGTATAEILETRALLPGTAGVSGSARGRVTIFFPGGTMPRVREFGRGAKLFVEGNFLAHEGQTPETIPRFRAVSVHTVEGAPVPEKVRTTVRSALLKRLEEKTWGGLGAALLLGVRENLEGDLALSFRNAGLSHILALSGMHLAFLSALLALVLKKPLGKRGALIGGLCFILVYVFLVGPQPSLVRAAIMYVLGSCLVLTGMARQPLGLLGLAFMIQILWDPLSAFSISFMLSYLALGGILFFGRNLGTLLRGRIPPAIEQGLSPSLGAFLATAPVVAFFFGILRPVGIIAGFIAVPLSSALMALALIWLAAADIPLLGSLLDYLLRLVQTILKQGIAFFSQAPGFKVLLPAVCIVTPLAIILLLILAEQQKRYRNYLAPFA
jgi:competence protein ComEC